MYLLDSNILLHWMFQTEKLSESIEEVMESQQICVSVASLWELTIKSMKGKVSVPSSFVFDVESEFQLIHILPEHISTLTELGAFHSDPFDRIMIAQAIYEDLIFVTTDSIIPRYPGLAVLKM